MLAVEMLTDSLYSHLLIVPVSNAVLDAKVAYIVSFSLLNEQFQVALCVESVQPSWWVAQAIYDIGLKTVGVVDDRSCTVFLFQAICVKFGLVLANEGRLACSLGFNDSQGQSIAAKEYIVAVALSARRDFDSFSSLFAF